jgi:hypothetical protein
VKAEVQGGERGWLGRNRQAQVAGSPVGGVVMVVEGLVTAMNGSSMGGERALRRTVCRRLFEKPSWSVSSGRQEKVWSSQITR